MHSLNCDYDMLTDFFKFFLITLMFSEWFYKCCCCSCIWKPPHWLVILYYPEGIDTSYKGKIPFSITITRVYGKTEYIYFFFCSLKVSIYIIMFSLILTVKLYINFDLYIQKIQSLSAINKWQKLYTMYIHVYI